MYPSPPNTNRTVGDVLAWLRATRNPDKAELAKAVGMSYTSYLKTERDQRELSFLMALRICRFYQLDIHEFVSMLGDQELQRADRSIIKQQEKIERKKAEALRATVIDISTSKVVPEVRL